ncbi:hypothetical protein BDN70DRAFT_726117 [Pholiota conissans]|uniref:Uncharacterized protein n=1 Tax=Pholiota conissans TaxID=109636 RepID=A0A9P6CZX9_9AGAR|nr:hypothetical protein BDN70DRAFT_726117 [Pholiota conissans]
MRKNREKRGRTLIKTPITSHFNSLVQFNTLQQEISTKIQKLMDITREHRNKAKEALQAKRKRKKDANQSAIIPIECATQKAAENRESVSLKKGGIVTEEAREMIRFLDNLEL